MLLVAIGHIMVSETKKESLGQADRDSRTSLIGGCTNGKSNLWRRALNLHWQLFST